MGRRRRRVVRIVKKKLPTVFTCPRCGEEAVRVTIVKQTGHATVLCALCQLKDEFPAHPVCEVRVNVYHLSGRMGWKLIFELAESAEKCRISSLLVNRHPDRFFTASWTCED